MGSLGWQEMLIILVVALIIFGPRKLPELGKTLGESLAQFRKASEDFKRTWEAEVDYEKARIDAPKPAEPSYSYSQSSTGAPAAETAPLSEPVAPPEGTIPATPVAPSPAYEADTTPKPPVAEPSAETRRDWM